MADDTALVLSLEAKFDKFERAMLDATKAVDKQTKLMEDKFVALGDVVARQLQSISGQFIGQLGFLGQAMVSLGPAGIAAATGLGAMVQALNTADEASQRLGQRAVALQKFSIGTGFSIAEAQGIKKAFSELAIDSDVAQKALSLFAIQLNEFKRTGGGPLVEALGQVDKSLITTMAQTDTTKEAFEIFIKALATMSTESRNAFARQAGGRGGIEVFAQLAVQIEAFFDAWKKGIASAKPKDEVDSMADAMRKLDAVQEKVGKEWDKALGSEELLRKKTQFYKELLGVLEAITNRSIFLKILNESELGKILQNLGIIEKFKPPAAAAPVVPGISDDKQQKLLEDMAEVEEAQKRIAAAQDATTKAREKELSTTSGTIANLQREKELSGGAFNPARARELDELILKQKELQRAQSPEDTRAAAAGNQFLTDTYRLQTLVLRERLGIATQQEVQEKKQIETRREIAQIVTTSAERETAVTNQVTDAIRLNQIAIREKLGIATESEILDGKRIETQRLLTQVTLDGAEKTRVALINEKESREKLEAQMVRASNLPGLTRMALDAQNVSKQFDQFAVRSVDAFADALVSAANGTKSFKDAFKDMAVSILNDLAKIIIRAQLLKLLGMAIPGIGGSVPAPSTPTRAGGGPVWAGQSFLVGERGPEMFTPSQAGFITPTNALPRGGGDINIGGPVTSINIEGAADKSTIAAMQFMLAERDKRFISDVASASRELRRRSVRT